MQLETECFTLPIPIQSISKACVYVVNTKEGRGFISQNKNFSNFLVTVVVTSDNNDN